jgi:hypothetical protein
MTNVAILSAVVFLMEVDVSAGNYCRRRISGPTRPRVLEEGRSQIHLAVRVGPHIVCGPSSDLT